MNWNLCSSSYLLSGACIYFHFLIFSNAFWDPSCLPVTPFPGNSVLWILLWAIWICLVLWSFFADPLYPPLFLWSWIQQSLSSFWLCQHVRQTCHRWLCGSVWVMVLSPAQVTAKSHPHCVSQLPAVPYVVSLCCTGMWCFCKIIMHHTDLTCTISCIPTALQSGYCVIIQI